MLDEKDAEMYQVLRLTALTTNPEAFGSTYEREMQFSIEEIKQRIVPSEKRISLGVFDESNVLIGIVTFIRETSIKMQHKGHIVGLYISAASRGQGVGNCLLTEMIELVRNWDGLEQISLTVVSTNLSAKHLYSSLGFKVYGTEKKAIKYEDQYYDEELMVLFL
nr:GNAT family protein [Carnobacterium mobile]